MQLISQPLSATPPLPPRQSVAEMSTPGDAAAVPSFVDLAHDHYLRQKYFASLDGLRCVAIFGVLTAHAFMSLLNLQDWGRQGVPLFFAISGFLITSLLLRERSRTGNISIKDFYLRRSLRIFPLYYAVLMLYVLIVHFHEHNAPSAQVFFHNLPFFATYTANWFMDTHLAETHFFHSWSLCIEEQYYLVWPITIWLFGRRTLGPVFAASAVLLATYILQPMVNAHTLNLGFFPNQVIRNLAPPILLGSLLAYGLHYRQTFKYFWPILGQAWSATAFFVLAGVFIYLRENKAEQHYLLQLAMVGIVGALCIRDRHPLRPLFANRVVVYIGTISYGMYMLNKLCAHTIQQAHLDKFDKYGFGFLILSGGMTIAVASISYYVYERPFLKIKDRFRRVEAKPD